MNLTEINQKIILVEKEYDKIQSTLEEIRKGFKAVLLDYASTWIKDTLEYHLIRENPEKAKQMGKSGLAAVRAEYKALIERLPRLVDHIINDNKKWPHKAEFGFVLKEHEYFSLKTTDILTEMIRSVVSQLGPILKKYGLIQFKQYGEWKAQGEELQYVIGFNLSPQLKKLIDDYKEQFGSYEKTLGDLASLNKNKSQEEARILWEEH
jgi:hypothetical protein